MSERLRILHVYKDYYPVLGGIENLIRVLAEAQAARGHQVTVLATNPGHPTLIQEMNGVRVIKAGRWTTITSTPISPALFVHLARQQADVTHLHFPHPPGEVANLLFGRGRPYILSYHSDIVRQRVLRTVYRPLMWQVLRRAGRLIAASPAYAASSPFLSALTEKCTIIPYGTDTARFEHVDSARVEALRRRLLPGPPSPVLVFVGRLRYYKGLDDLLRALPAIPNARLLVGGEGPMRAEWERLAQELNLGNRVIFAGDVDNADLPAFYRLGDLFVLPSNVRAEAFGIVLIEAMASGLPLVCTEVGSATSWINQHGKTGLNVPARDPRALAQAINELLADPARRRAMGEAARQRAQSEFGEQTMIGRIEQVYHDVLCRQ